MRSPTLQPVRRRRVQHQPGGRCPMPGAGGWAVRRAPTRQARSRHDGAAAQPGRNAPRTATWPDGESCVPRRWRGRNGARDRIRRPPRRRRVAGASWWERLWLSSGRWAMPAGGRNIKQQLRFSPHLGSCGTRSREVGDVLVDGQWSFLEVRAPGFYQIIAMSRPPVAAVGESLPTAHQGRSGRVLPGVVVALREYGSCAGDPPARCVPG